ncbi:MAG TPA: BON domain-containing protein [Chloroflexota bacterium]|jgi:osmotically-inducible protein OsmY
MKTDREIQDAVERRLRSAPGVDAEDVGVSVQHGVVILTGAVRTFAEREAAEQTALDTESVQDIANEIRVEIPRQAHHTDQEIAHSVRGTLELHSRVPQEHIKSSTSHGVVTLHGCVGCWQDVVDAEEAVGDLSGVEDVIDELVVTSAESEA